MKILFFCGNEPSDKVKEVMKKLADDRHQVLQRNPDYFSTAGVERDVKLVIVSERHPEAGNIKAKYEKLGIDVKFVVESEPEDPNKEKEKEKEE